MCALGYESENIQQSNLEQWRHYHFTIANGDCNALGSRLVVEKSALSIRDLGDPFFESHCLNLSKAAASPYASPRTVPAFVFSHHPRNFNFVASACVCLRKKTPCTFPWISNDNTSAAIAHAAEKSSRMATANLRRMHEELFGGARRAGISGATPFEAPHGATGARRVFSKCPARRHTLPGVFAILYLRSFAATPRCTFDMLYAIAAAAIAFTAPGLAPTAPARATPAVMAERKGAFWQRPDWIEMQEKAAAESAAATALSNVCAAWTRTMAF